MQLHKFEFNPFYENTYVLYDQSGEAIIIDPGCYEAYEQAELTNFITKNQLKPIAVVNTHCHIDHVLGNAFCKRHFGIPLWIPADEQVVFDAVPSYSSNYGFQRYEHTDVDMHLGNTGVLAFGNTELEIRFAPGHAPGHLMYYHQESKQLIAGDVIFRQSIGRTDLPGGNYETLEASIRNMVYTLPNDTNIFPGHGTSTTVGHEKQFNPFVSE